MDAAASGSVLFSRIPMSCLKLLKVGLIGAGLLIIGLAAATYFLELNLVSVYQWLNSAFGPLYLTLFSLLCATSMYAIVQLKTVQPADSKSAVWYEVGQQAASGIATLALTFTLLGISLGIESLSNQTLNPETVSSVIQDLTKHFSQAFMTTVLGLPTAHIFRSVLSVRWVAIQST